LTIISLLHVSALLGHY